MADVAADTTTTAVLELSADGTVGTYSDRLEFIGDRDWIRVTLETGILYDFYLSLQGSGATDIGDSLLLIRASNGTALSQNDNRTNSINSHISFTAPASGTYYIDAGAVSTHTGFYSVLMTRVSATNDFYGDLADVVNVPPNYRAVGGGGADTINLSNGALDALGEQGDDVVNGNTFANRLSGGTGDDSIGGASGDDILFGNAGDDFIQGSSDQDQIFGGIGFDALFGEQGNDIINGGADDDRLTGGDGFDTLDGGTGIDIALYSSSLNVTVKVNGASVATVFVGGVAEDTVRNIEDIYGSSDFNDALTGDGLVNHLYGAGGGDVLNGGGGADFMAGGLGDDRFTVDNAGDVVIENAGEGSDTVIATMSHALQAGQSVELLRTVGSASTAAINLTGNEFVQTLQGNAAANTLDGRGGADVMQGFAGNDTYRVDNPGDVIVDTSGTDQAIVTASINYTLAANVAIETLRTTGSSSTYIANLHGNNLNNLVQGNNAAGVLSGGLGTDTLTGFGGNDTFRFNTALGPSNIDTITDFSVPNDSIQIDNAVFTGLPTGTLAAAAFRTGSAAADSSDRIIYNAATGALLFDDDGTGAHAAKQFAKVSAGLAMTNADFIVI